MATKMRSVPVWMVLMALVVLACTRADEGADLGPDPCDGVVQRDSLLRIIGERRVEVTSDWRIDTGSCVVRHRDRGLVLIEAGSTDVGYGEDVLERTLESGAGQPGPVPDSVILPEEDGGLHAWALVRSGDDIFVRVAVVRARDFAEPDRAVEDVGRLLEETVAWLEQVIAERLGPTPPPGD